MVIEAFDAQFNATKGADIPAELKFTGPAFIDGKQIDAHFIKAYEFTGGIIEETNLNAWTEAEKSAVRIGFETGITLAATELSNEPVLSTADIAVRVNKLAGERAGLIVNESYQVVNEIVDRGLKAGSSTETIRLEILGKYDTWKGYRAETIARTETANAVNTGKRIGAEAMAKEYGLTLIKQWVSTIDNNTRSSHLAANRQKRKLNEPFDLAGGQLMNPGEYGGPPEETINCRCTVVFSVLD